MWAQAVLGQMLCPAAERWEMQRLNILCCEQLLCQKYLENLQPVNFLRKWEYRKKVELVRRSLPPPKLCYNCNYRYFLQQKQPTSLFFSWFFSFKISPARSCHALERWCRMSWNVSCGPLETDVMPKLSAARGVWSTETCQQKQVNRIEQGKKKSINLWINHAAARENYGCMKWSL